MKEEDVTDSNVVGDNLFVGEAVIVVNLGSVVDSTIGKQSTKMPIIFLGQAALHNKNVLFF